LDHHPPHWELYALPCSMSTLRYRQGKLKSPRADDSPHHDNESPTNEPLINLSSGYRLKSFLAKPRGKRRNSFIFLLGGLFGICVALFFANHNEVISLDALLDLNLDTLIDVIPQGALRDAREFTVR
jgi:phospholipid:diacylglycerol acyltransferase